ncbi:hypothetical protein [Brucella thiophenivorans]|uniref:Uncharacterized protein n=1 Tax=Brucella thiophenivorans TaxID=571255 RepID=A0A256FTP4_9HYPH|nr:hypothetical protein [Brucella thiophenivorans]OYR18252.1 hypothetical protein CEV31_4264 [Brucella thiophenivorans]
MSDDLLEKGNRQIIQRICEELGLSEKEGERMMQDLVLLGFKSFSPEAAQYFLRQLRVDQPLKTMMLDVLDSLKTLNLNVHNIDVKDDLLSRKLGDLNAAVNHLNESNSNHDAMVADIKEKLEGVVSHIFDDLQKQMMAAASQKFLNKDDASAILRKGFMDLRYAQKDHFDKIEQHQRDMYKRQEAMNEKVVANSEGWFYGAIMFAVGSLFGIAICFMIFVR